MMLRFIVKSSAVAEIGDELGVEESILFALVAGDETQEADHHDDEQQGEEEFYQVGAVRLAGSDCLLLVELS
jgi:hypothetical protein